MFENLINSYEKVREKSPLSKLYDDVFISFFFSSRISPIFTIYFLKKKISPNTITIYMILSGWLGGFLFMFDNLYLKIIGYMFIHLWFILDCSDGEVARITKTFSKMGKELDYVAHIVNHPMFAISFAISILQLSNNTLSDFWLLVIFSLLIIFNLIGRGLMSLQLIYDSKISIELDKKNENNISKLRIYIDYILRFFCEFPNIATIFPLFYFIDTYYATSLSLVYIGISLFVTVVIVARLIYKTMRDFHNL